MILYENDGLALTVNIDMYSQYNIHVLRQLYLQVLCLFPGIITGVGLSFLQFVDLNSFRNIFILGVSLFFGISISNWMIENQDAVKTGK